MQQIASLKCRHFAPRHFAMAKVHFKTGDQIPTSGIYRVLHDQHRLPHDVTLIKGERFPRCARCEDRVEFEQLHTAPDDFDRKGKIVLHAIPPIAGTDDKAA